PWPGRPRARGGALRQRSSPCHHSTVVLYGLVVTAGRGPLRGGTTSPRGPAVQPIRGTGPRPGILLRPAADVVGEGSVSERPKEHASKACVGASPPWVQIPPLPHKKHQQRPLTCANIGRGPLSYPRIHHLPMTLAFRRSASG